MKQFLLKRPWIHAQNRWLSSWRIETSCLNPVILVLRICIMTFRIYANNTDVTQYVSRQSLRITEQLNNRSNTCEFATLNYKIDQSSLVYIYEWYELREDVTADDDLKVRDTFKRFDNFAVGDEVIVDPQGAWRQFVTIDAIDNTLKTISINTNITASAWTFIGRLIFAWTVERNPDEQIGYTENFEHLLTVSDRTPALNRKNVVDVYENMYSREIIWRMIYLFCANDTSVVLNNFDSARTQSGVARAMTNETTDLIEWTASQSTGATGAWTATRTKTITAQDITDATDIRLRHKIWSAVWSKITSMNVRVGNDSSNYLERNSSFIDTLDESCRNYQAFSIERATTTWTVNLATIDRLQINVVANASIAAWWILFDEITATSWWFKIGECVRWTRTFTRVNWNYEKITNIIEDICKKQWLFRKVDYEKNVSVFESNDTPAPFEITDTSKNYWNMSIKADTSMLRNRQVVRGGEAASSVLYEQIEVADWQQTSFKLDYKPKDITVEVDTWSWYVAKTVGVENLVDETTVNFVFNFSEKVVRNGNHAKLSSWHKIRIKYYPYQAIRVRVTSPTSIATMKALAGGDWIFDWPVINDSTISSFDDARKRAKAEIDAYSNPIISATFVTEQWWLKAWQIIRIQDTSRSLDSQFLIQRVVRNSVDGAKSSYSVDCASTMFGLIEFFQYLLKQSWKLSDDASELVDIVVNADETITITFNAVFTKKSKTFLAWSVEKKVFDFIGDEWTVSATWPIWTSEIRKATKTAGATWTAWFWSSNHNNWKEMFVNVTASAWSQYMSIELNSLLVAKPSTDYTATARIENLVAWWLTWWQWLQLAVQEIGVTSTIEFNNSYLNSWWSWNAQTATCSESSWTLTPVWTWITQSSWRILHSWSSWSYLQCAVTRAANAKKTRFFKKIKFTNFTSSSNIVWHFLSTYVLCSVSMWTDQKLQVELPWTWSCRIKTTMTFTAWVEYDIVVRINDLVLANARVVTDADIFVNWTLQSKWFTATWNNTNNPTTIQIGAYNSTTSIMNWSREEIQLHNEYLDDSTIAAIFAGDIIKTNLIWRRSWKIFKQNFVASVETLETVYNIIDRTKYIYPTDWRCFAFDFALNADWTDSPSSQLVFKSPFLYFHIRNTTNQLQFRFDDSTSSVTPSDIWWLSTLWTGDRTRHRMICIFWREWVNTRMTWRMDWQQVLTWTRSNRNPRTLAAWNIVVWEWNLDIANFSWYKFRTPVSTTWLHADDITSLLNYQEPKKTNWIQKFIDLPMQEWTWSVLRDSWPLKLDATITTMTRSTASWLNRAKTKDIYWILVTNNLVNNRNTKQEFKKINEIAFTSNAWTKYFNIIAKVLESTGKVSIADIILEEDETEATVNPAFSDFSSAQ